MAVDRKPFQPLREQDSRQKTLYKEGSLPLRIDEDADIGRGIDAYFADLNRFTSNQQRLRHLQQVHACIGNPKSPIWREIKGFIESYKV